MMDSHFLILQMANFDLQRFQINKSCFAQLVPERSPPRKFDILPTLVPQKLPSFGQSNLKPMWPSQSIPQKLSYFLRSSPEVGESDFPLDNAPW